jgi:hypothetical protein
MTFQEKWAICSDDVRDWMLDNLDDLITEKSCLLHNNKWLKYKYYSGPIRMLEHKKNIGIVVVEGIDKQVFGITEDCFE